MNFYKNFNSAFKCYWHSFNSLNLMVSFMTSIFVTMIVFDLEMKKFLLTCFEWTNGVITGITVAFLISMWEKRKKLRFLKDRKWWISKCEYWERPIIVVIFGYFIHASSILYFFLFFGKKFLLLDLPILSTELILILTFFPIFFAHFASFYALVRSHVIHGYVQKEASE